MTGGTSAEADPNTRSTWRTCPSSISLAYLRGILEGVETGRAAASWPAAYGACPPRRGGCRTGWWKTCERCRFFGEISKFLISRLTTGIVGITRNSFSHGSGNPGSRGIGGSVMVPPTGEMHTYLHKSNYMNFHEFCIFFSKSHLKPA